MLAFLLSMLAGTEKVLVDTQVFRPYILIDRSRGQKIKVCL